MNKKVYIFRSKDEKKINNILIDFYRKTDTLTTDMEDYKGDIAVSIWGRKDSLKERVKILETMFKENKVKALRNIVIN